MILKLDVQKHTYKIHCYDYKIRKIDVTVLTFEQSLLKPTQRNYCYEYEIDKKSTQRNDCSEYKI